MAAEPGAPKPGKLHLPPLVPIDQGTNSMRDREFEFIRSLVYERSRITLGSEKSEVVATRLGPRLRANGISDLGEYCELLKSDDSAEEISLLIDLLAIHHTFFFREKDHFDLVRSTIVPELLRRKAAERWPRLLAWSAACSSGEESYSLAITLAEALAGTNWPFQVEATDISEGVLKTARAAIYGGDIADRVPKESLKAFFQRGVKSQAGKFRVNPALREKVSFHQSNLLSAGRARDSFHLIFCRNVMIYFNEKTREDLLRSLTAQLVPGGYLVVGHTESLVGTKHNLEAVQSTVYRRPQKP
jgi:chemotaxis protein methyltransferase CheR